jgi:hypothetical protein
VTVSIQDQLKCVRRELTMRERVYGRRVEAGKMTPGQAQREIDAMQAVVETLQRIEAGELLL